MAEYFKVEIQDGAENIPDHGIVIVPHSWFIDERSAPQESLWFFGYRIAIINVGPQSAKLLTRHWYITDAMDRTNEVEGEGVVGHQPQIEPMHGFRYTSFCPLGTECGTMRGSYIFERDGGERFEVDVPGFILASDTSVH